MVITLLYSHTARFNFYNYFYVKLKELKMNQKIKYINLTHITSVPFSSINLFHYIVFNKQSQEENIEYIIFICISSTGIEAKLFYYL